MHRANVLQGIGGLGLESGNFGRICIVKVVAGKSTSGLGGPAPSGIVVGWTRRF